MRHGSRQNAPDAVRRILGEAARADVTAFPGGNVSISIHSADHYAAVAGATESAWGGEVDPDTDDEGFTGYQNAAKVLLPHSRA